MASDVAYIVRPGDDNEELRHSLRSLANLPHGRLWVAGHKPAWLTNVEHVPTEQDHLRAATKHANAMRNLRALLEAVGDTFVLFNDDFHVTAPINTVPVLHRGPARAVVAQYKRAHPTSPYTAAMVATLDWLRGLSIPDPLSYEMHTPLTIHRDTMRDVIQRAERDGLDVDRFHNRTAYGNLAHIGGEYAEDVKVYNGLPGPVPAPFVSTNDTSFATGAIGRRLRGMFPEPSPYEVA